MLRFFGERKKNKETVGNLIIMFHFTIKYDRCFFL